MVRLSCGLKITRGILVVLNVIFLIFGLVLFGFGIYLTAAKKFDVAFFEDVKVDMIGGTAIQNIGIIILLVGFLTVVLSIIGGLGALMSKRVLLYVYAFTLGLLMLTELGLFIAALVLKSDIRDEYDKNLWTIFQDAYTKNNTANERGIERLEKEFECCGVYGPEDYGRVNGTAPDTCYTGTGPDRQIFQTGCSDAILDWINDELPAISGIIGAVLVLEIFGLIASISMAVAITHSSYGDIAYNS